MNTQNGNGVVVFHLIPLEKGVQSDLLLGMEPQPLKGDSKGKPCKPGSKDTHTRTYWQKEKSPHFPGAGRFLAFESSNGGDCSPIWI